MPPPAEGFTARFVVGPALRAQPDGRLVKLVREGYENAFEEIVRRYGKPLTRYAAALVGSRAEDVTQDAFSKALLALRRDGREIELRPWLFRIVRNTALNELRDRPPSAEALAEVIAGGNSPAEEIERCEELTDLMRRLRSLPDAQRAAIVMRELEGLSHEEIASALGLSGGAARQAIFRARRTLRNGAGMLLPLPLLKALLVGAATAPTEAVAGAAGVGGVAGVGAGAAVKAATATVLVAGAVGAGVAIDHDRHASVPESPGASAAQAEDPASAGPAAGLASAPTEEAGDSSGPSGGGNSGPGGDRGSSGHGGERHGDDRDQGDDSGNPGPGGEDDERHSETGDDRGGNGGSSGDGGLDNADDADDHAGRGSGGSGAGGGGSSGPGAGGSSGPGGGGSSGGDDEPTDSSGPGSGSESISSGGDSGPDSGSGSNSGSGSGSDDSGSSEEDDGEPVLDATAASPELDD